MLAIARSAAHRTRGCFASSFRSGRAFVAAGAVPLVPYLFSGTSAGLFATSTGLSLVVLFAVGAARARVGTGSWWSNGLEMLVLGVIVGAVAYYAGAVVAAVVKGW